MLSLTEGELQSALDLLIARRLVSNVAGFNARVARYQHRFCNTEFGDLHLSAHELGVVCELLLRGPQTPGELRSRTARLCQFDDVSQVDATLQSLIEKGPCVIKLAREPGKRESRYAHLFSGEPEQAAVAPSSGGDRLAELEAENAALRAQVAELQARINELMSAQ